LAGQAGSAIALAAWLAPRRLFSLVSASRLLLPVWLVRFVLMKRRFVLLLLFCAAVYGSRASAVLPDACGKEDVSFDIRLEKKPPAPAGPENGKAQVFFIEKSSKPPLIGCLDCRTEARFGVDGSWVGATKDNSYFVISLDPGVHHVCAVRGKEVDAKPLTVEAGKIYYYQVEYKAVGTDYGTTKEPNYQVKKSVSFAMLNEDEGKYRVKASALSIARPRK